MTRETDQWKAKTRSGRKREKRGREWKTCACEEGEDGKGRKKDGLQLPRVDRTTAKEEKGRKGKETSDWRQAEGRKKKMEKGRKTAGKNNEMGSEKKRKKKEKRQTAGEELK